MPVSWGNIARSTIYVPNESNWLSDLVRAKRKVWKPRGVLNAEAKYITSMLTIEYDPEESPWKRFGKL